MLVHRLTHGLPELAEHLAVPVVQQALDGVAVSIGCGVRDGSVRPVLRHVRGMLARAAAEHQRVEQGVRAEAVAAVDADAGRLTGGVETRQRGLAVYVGLDPAHLVVHARLDGNRLLEDVDVGEIAGNVEDLRKLLSDNLFPQVATVQQHAAVDAASLVDLRLLRPGHHVPGRKLHHAGSVALHETLSLAVEQVCALSSGALRYEHAAALERRRMVLDHLHVHERRARPVRKGHAVAGTDQGVGAGLEDPSQAACGHDDRLGADHVYLAAQDLHHHRT